MLLAAIALALATGDVVAELSRFPAPPPPPVPGPPPLCCACRSKPIDLAKFGKALTGGDRAKRSRAANDLAGILEYCYEPKATLLLVPWISDPSWVTERREGARLLVVEKTGWDRTAEAVPSLLRAVEHDPSPGIRSAAAHSLALIGDPRAVPALRRALRVDGDKAGVAMALMEMNAFTDAELERGVDAYITGDPRSDDAVIGMIAARNFERDGVAVRVVQAIDDQRASAPVIVDAVMHPKELRKQAAAQLALLRTRGGVRAGIAAAIIGDPGDIRRVLKGDDVEAIRALRAAARFSHEWTDR